MKEKRLVDANHFMQVLKNIEYALKGELTHGKIKTSVVPVSYTHLTLPTN